MAIESGANVTATTRPPRSHKIYRWVLVGLVASACLVGLVLRFGGSILVAPDPLPKEAEVTVVLLGSGAGGKARRDEAVRLLQAGVTDYVMLSVGKVYYWGQWLPDLVRRYLEKEYGHEVASRVVLCEMNVDSTTEEVLALRECLGHHGWRSIIVVTSNYHTRRARMIWKATLAGADASFTVAVHGVLDGSFKERGWWRSRRYAKTWLLEFTKLVWFFIEGVPNPAPAKQVGSRTS